MLLNVKALIIVLAIAGTIFRLAEPMVLQFTSARDFELRRNLWLALTVAGFLAPSFWVFWGAPVPGATRGALVAADAGASLLRRANGLLADGGSPSRPGNHRLRQPNAQIALFYGGVTLVLFLAFVFIAVAKVYRAAGEVVRKDPELASIGRSLLACMFGTLLIIATGNLLGGNEKVFYLLSALLFAYPHLPRGKKVTAPSRAATTWASSKG